MGVQKIEILATVRHKGGGGLTSSPMSDMLWCPVVGDGFIGIRNGCGGCGLVVGLSCGFEPNGTGVGDALRGPGDGGGEALRSYNELSRFQFMEKIVRMTH